MPIRINLLAEIQAAEDASRRDPAKRAAWIGGFVIALVLVWAVCLQFKVYAVKSELAVENARLAKLDTGAKAAAANLTRTGDVERRIAALQTLATNRVLWAPTLNALQNVLVDNIQLTRFKCDQNYSLVNKKPTERELQKNPKAKPIDAAVERVLMTIEAKDFANPTDLNYNRFISEIAAAELFKRSLDKNDGIALKDRTPPQPDPTDARRRFILFSIECKYPEKSRTL